MLFRRAWFASNYFFRCRFELGARGRSALITIPGVHSATVGRSCLVRPKRGPSGPFGLRPDPTSPRLRKSSKQTRIVSASPHRAPATLMHKAKSHAHRFEDFVQPDARTRTRTILHRSRGKISPELCLTSDIMADAADRSRRLLSSSKRRNAPSCATGATAAINARAATGISIATSAGHSAASLPGHHVGGGGHRSHLQDL